MSKGNDKKKKTDKNKKTAVSSYKSSQGKGAAIASPFAAKKPK